MCACSPTHFPICPACEAQLTAAEAQRDAQAADETAQAAGLLADCQRIADAAHARLHPTTVYHLGTDQVLRYTLPPRQAVIAARAQAEGDYNTWDYETKYGPRVREGKYGFHLGDFSAPFIKEAVNA
jgi:hypothetical protein